MPTSQTMVLSDIAYSLLVFGAPIEVAPAQMKVGIGADHGVELVFPQVQRVRVLAKLGFKVSVDDFNLLGGVRPNGEVDGATPAVPGDLFHCTPAKLRVGL